MRLVLKSIVFLIAVVWVAGCKTPEPPQVANTYQPIFDQTKKVYVKTPSNKVNLDTTVLIRSNLRDTIAFYWDTITMLDEFVFESGELAVPLELINEKPPTFDTFLVASKFEFTAEYVDLLFPEIPDSILFELNTDTLAIDSLAFETDSLMLDTLHEVGVDTIMAPQKENLKILPETIQPPITTEKNGGFISNIFSSIFKSKKERAVDRSRKIIEQNLKISQTKELAVDLINTDSLLVAELDTLQFQELDSIIEDEPKPIKYFYTVDEILADSTRDLFQADTMLAELLAETPWSIGDSIPFLNNFNNRFLDSVLMLSFDTVYVEIIDSSKIVPQLPFEVLTNEVFDTLKFEHKIYIKDQVTFRLYHPNEDDIYIEMVRVVGDNFKIGSNYFDEDERPAYNIKVNSFLLSKYEVTNKLFCYFLNDLKCDSLGQIEGNKVIDLFHPATKIRQNQFTKKFSPIDGYDDFPIINVSWVGAQIFCKSAGGRLPSEAQWEYAAKGGRYAKRIYINRDNTDYDYVNRFAGGNYMRELGWFVDNSRGQLRVGGKLKPNELGLYDMCGNVWEWCYDKYSKDFYKRNSRSRNPINMEGQNIRVNRGGSWSSDANYCRITNRNYLNQFSYNPYLGFRYQREWK
ncbi:MAG: SUMF1/EgtB/PvdO family nonheme iron enzyme [Prolixibacteraceae bacterium]|jgi:formylglycine-generating enzyme required for sulfatase activity|nr:SUMF1/EgtB/PvdO family nonheme iron enzyme [Prolixibacteraceae bacterium]